MKEKKKYSEKTGGKYSKFQKKKITNLIVDNDRIVLNQIQQNHQILNPLEITNFIALRNETDLISTREIKNIIKTFKQRAPVEETFTKYHLDNVPPNIIRNLAIIFNASLAIGYHPQQFKNSIMIFIPKEGKSPIEHVNYRPISLLNIPG